MGIGRGNVLMDNSTLSIDGESASMRLVLSRSMHVEQVDEASATIYLQSNGSRIRIPRILYNLLLRFEEPRSVLSVAGPEGWNSRVAGAIGNLRAKGFLIAEGEVEVSFDRRLVTDPPVRLFDCPAQKLVAAQTDVVVIGVPYDLSDASSAGARNGPVSIRDTSLQVLYAIDRRTGRPRGWFDVDRGCAILQGISIADCGDVFVDYGESQAALFARISEVLGKVAHDGALPVLLGGDASISYPGIAILQSREPLAVIRIGCVAKRAGSIHPSFVTPSSLPDRALQLPGVMQYVHVGACGMASEEVEGALQGFVHVSVSELKKSGISALKRHLKVGQKVYLGVDMNALEAPGGAAAGDFECDRFNYADVHSLLCDIGTTYSIVGLDLVGLNPLKDDWGVTSMTALHILLTAISAAKNSE